MVNVKISDNCSRFSTFGHVYSEGPSIFPEVMQGIADTFQINLNPNNGGKIEVERTTGPIEDLKTRKFTKGQITRKREGRAYDPNRTGAQINLTFPPSEINELLKGDRSSKERPFDQLRSEIGITIERSIDNSGHDEKTKAALKRNIPLLTYYLSQIPIMALQNKMNQIRGRLSRNPDNWEGKNWRDRNREEFSAYHPQNRKLLLLLSMTKDAMGFWIKAGLNDFMDPAFYGDDAVAINRFIAEMSDDWKGYMNNISERLWEDHSSGLKELEDEMTQKGYNIRGLLSLEGIQGDILGQIRERADRNLDRISRGEPIPRPGKTNFPNFDQRATKDLMDFRPVPFMLRPDTHVKVGNGILIEPRSLNNGKTNTYLQRYDMPLYRRKRPQRDMRPDALQEAHRNNRELGGFIGYTRGSGPDQAPTLYFENGRITQEHRDIDNIGQEITQDKGTTGLVRANVRYNPQTRKWEAEWMNIPPGPEHRDALNRMNDLLDQEITDRDERVRKGTFLYEYRKYDGTVHHTDFLDDYETHISRGPMYGPDREVTQKVADRAVDTYPVKAYLLAEEIEDLDGEIHHLLDLHESRLPSEVVQRIGVLMQQREATLLELKNRMDTIAKIQSERWKERLGGNPKRNDIEWIYNERSHRLSNLAGDFLDALGHRPKIIDDFHKETNLIENQISRRARSPQVVGHMGPPNRRAGQRHHGNIARRAGGPKDHKR